MPSASPEEWARIKLEIEAELRTGAEFDFEAMVAKYPKACGGKVGRNRLKKWVTAIKAKIAAQTGLDANVPSAIEPSEAPHIDYLDALRRMFNDAELMRGQAVKLQDDGSEKIVNPPMFAAALSERRRLIETGVKTTQHIWDLQRIQNFHDMIVEIVVKELAGHPELQLSIMRKISDFNARNKLNPGSVAK